MNDYVVAPVTGPPQGVGIRLIPGNVQHVGARHEQQDTFYFSDLDDAELVARAGALIVVADGMGGLSDGRHASQLACETFRSMYEAKRDDEPIPDALLRSLRAANDAVVAEARRRKLLGEMGTTLVAAVVSGWKLYWISVGDSRLYLLRGDELVTITLDHDYARVVDRAAARGDRSWEAAASDPQRAALASFVGHENLDDIDRSLRAFSLRAGDRLLLCSDGLYNALSTEEMRATLASTGAADATHALLRQALGKELPKQDNITAATVDVMPGTSAAMPHAARRRRGVLALAGVTVTVGLALIVLGLAPPTRWSGARWWPFEREAAGDSADSASARDSVPATRDPPVPDSTRAAPDSIPRLPIDSLPATGAQRDTNSGL
jgi:serine/threonine protein phosphatase PrpC